jgi:hypothetical protein
LPAKRREVFCEWNEGVSGIFDGEVLTAISDCFDRSFHADADCRGPNPKVSPWAIFGRPYGTRIADSRLGLRFLFVGGEIFEEPVTALEHRDALEVHTPDLGEIALIMVIADRFLCGSGGGTQRLSEKDCGEYLHWFSLRWSHKPGSLRALSW